MGDCSLKIIKLGIIDKDFYPQLLYEAAGTKDQSEKKLQFLETLVSKEIDINTCITSAFLYYKYPFFQYIYENHTSIKPNDLILSWFIEKKIDMSGTETINNICSNNIFYAIIEGCNNNPEDIIRITKAVCNILLRPITLKLITFFCSIALFNKKNPSRKLTKPLTRWVANFFIQDEPVIKAIIEKLSEKIEDEYISSDYLMREKYTPEELQLFNPLCWQKEPLKQYPLCAVSQNK